MERACNQSQRRRSRRKVEDGMEKRGEKGGSEANCRALGRFTKENMAIARKHDKLNDDRKVLGTRSS
eukprot:1418323-Pleurochrysis_carterae.AAC.1